jgi:hypothetical protein
MAPQPKRKIIGGSSVCGLQEGSIGVFCVWIVTQYLYSWILVGQKGELADISMK